MTLEIGSTFLVKDYSVEAIKTFTLNDADFVDGELCPVCSSLENSIVLTEQVGKKYSSLRTRLCKQCSHVFLERRPKHSWYLNMYQHDWRLNEQSSRITTTSKKILQKLKFNAESFVEKKFFSNKAVSLASLNKIVDYCEKIDGERLSFAQKDVFEVGCGNGKTLQKFLQLGANAYAIEATPHRAKASSELGIKVKNIPIEEVGIETFGVKFDLIVIHHVLEHLFDPNLFFEMTKKLLKPNGYIYVAVPNVFFSSLINIAHTCVHINEFSIQSLQLLAEKHGFMVRKFSVDWEIQMLLQFPQNDAQPATYRQPVMRVDAEKYFKEQLGEVFENKSANFNVYWGGSVTSTSPGKQNFISFEPTAKNQSFSFPLIFKDTRDNAAPIWGDA